MIETKLKKRNFTKTNILSKEKKNETELLEKNNSFNLIDYFLKYCKKENQFSSEILPQIPKEKIAIQKRNKSEYKIKTFYTLKKPKKLIYEDLNNKYIIGKLITKIRNGNIRKCKNKINGMNYLIKIYDENEKEKKNLIEKEILLMKELFHPNIIKFIEKIKIESNTFIIMEYFKGKTLLNFIRNQRKKKLNEIQSKRILFQLISALNYLHKNNICHRNLNLNNILIDEKFNIKIIDLGFLNEKINLNLNDENLNFFPPEILNIQDYNNFSSDIWNIGIILYFILCGYLPFNNKNKSELIDNINNANFFLPQNLSFGVKELIKKMICVNPISRISMNNILRNDWLLNM
jgi:serine/threonine protein kinase